MLAGRHEPASGRRDTTGRAMREHILITGATGGIGRALALHWAAAGAALSLTGRREDALAEVAGAARAHGAEVATARIDVTDAAGMADWIASRDEARPLSMAVANAGIGGRAVMTAGGAEDGDVARAVLATNMVGVVNTVAPALPRMMARRRGRVVLVSSVAALVGLAQAPAYSASKAAVRAYGEALRRLARPAGVTVTTVLPGFVDTAMSASLGRERPWCWSAERAAARIAAAGEAGRAELVFPWQMRVAVGLLGLLPASAADRVVAIASGQRGADRR